jgi:hypothetical protein
VAALQLRGGIVIANAYAGDQQEPDRLVRRGDVVRFLPRRGARRWAYVRVTSDIQRRARYSPRAPEWVTFTGRRVRCYDHAAVIGPECSYDVKVAGLHKLPPPGEQPQRSITAITPLTRG